MQLHSCMKRCENDHIIIAGISLYVPVQGVNQLSVCFGTRSTARIADNIRFVDQRKYSGNANRNTVIRKGICSEADTKKHARLRGEIYSTDVLWL